MKLTRSHSNPILAPDTSKSWESFATFNGTVIKQNDAYILLYRAMGDEKVYQGRKMRLSVIGKATSPDGEVYSERVPFITPQEKWEFFGCEDPRVTHIDGRYYIFYTALASYPPNASSIRVAVAISDDLKTIAERHLVTPFNAKAMTLFPEKINGKYTALLTVNSDRPPSVIAYAQFDRIEEIWDTEFWCNWYRNLDSYVIKLRRVNSDQVEIGAPPVKTKDGWLLIYSYIKHYLSDEVKKEFRIEALLLDRVDITKIIGRVETPLLTPETPYELAGQIENIVFPSGAVVQDDVLQVYYGGADSVCAKATVNWSLLRSAMETHAPATLKCEKFANNPLLQPIPQNDWESAGVCNTSAVEIDGVVYLVYRAFTKNNTSNLGLAVSHDGYCIDERLTTPIFPLRTEYEKPVREGAGSGAEDPRITQIGDALYMCYTAYDGDLARLAFTSIPVDDFVRRNWDAWATPSIISPPGVMDKDGALFPEKINGKYAFFHRIEPNIIIDYADSLDFSKGNHLETKNIISPRNGSWDGIKIGINGPPIKTDKGWLVMYHGISKIDRHYRIGAFLLDSNDLTRIIGRASYPILEPEVMYEREGVVPNVIFSNGHIVRDNTILIYYGGADKVICGAEINLDKLIDYCVRSENKQYLSNNIDFSN